MSSSDLFTADYPHGTPEGYDGPDGHDGCRGGACPGGDLWGLTCKDAKRMSRGDYRYQKLAKQGLTPAEIADKLGLIPTGTTTKPVTKRAPATTHDDGTIDVGPVTVDETPVEGTRDTAAHKPTADEIADLFAVPKITFTDPAERTDELSPAAPPETKAIRAWAIERGYTVKPRGVLPTHIIDQYWIDHGLLDPGPIPTVHTAEPQVDTQTAEVDTATPDPATIVPEPDGRRPEWGYVTLTEDLARAQTERDTLTEELDEAKSELTRARSLAARLEEELARASVKHAVVTRLRSERDTARREAKEIRDAVTLEKDETIARLSRALEFTIRQWATERDRTLAVYAAAVNHEWNGALTRPVRIAELAHPAPTAETASDPGLGGRIRRGWAATR